MIFLFLGYVGYEVSNYFTGEGVNYGVLYHLFHGNISSAGVLGVYTELIRTVIIVSTLFVVLLIGLLYAKQKVVTRDTAIRHAWCLLLFSFFTHPLLLAIYGIYKHDTVYAINMEALRSIMTQSVDLSTRDPMHFSTYFERHPITRMTNTPQNLVLIYLEGVEQTFSDPELFDTLTPQLDRIAREAVTFTTIGQLPESSYTIAGMVASQCGIPLIGVSHGNTGEGFVDSYLPGATCLGDILKQYGYTTEYIGGADNSFAGKNTFLRAHGYDTVLGKEELTDLYRPETTQGWGLYDDTLFTIVTERFDVLVEHDRPFLLTTLTLDTHPPTGYISPTCEQAGIATRGTLMENAVACTDYLVGQLVDHIRASDAAAHTTIVIVSDHLAMYSAITPTLDTRERTNRFHILAPNTVPRTYDTRGTTIDIGTTLLPYIGYRGTIGLGQQLTQTGIQPTIDLVQMLYKTWRPEFLSLWKFPTIEHGLHIDQVQETVFIDARAYHVPAIITIDPALRSTIGFRKYQADDLFFTLLQEQHPDTISLIIDTCLTFARVGIRVTVPTTPGQYCAVGAKGPHIQTTVHPLEEHTFLSRETLLLFLQSDEEVE